MKAEEVRLSIAMQAHPSREPMVNWTLERLGHGTDRWPENAHMQVIYDPGVGSCWLTAYACWKSVPHEFRPTHHMQMTDDAIPCEDFIASACKAIAAKPDVPISLFCRNQDVLEVQKQNKHWLRITSRPWGYGFILPVDMVPSFLTWAEQPEIMDRFGWWGEHDDVRMHGWLKSRGTPHTWCTVPSLVEHGLPQDSLMGHANRLRVATWFLGMETSALSIDWND